MNPTIFFKYGNQEECPAIFTWDAMLKSPKYTKFKELGKENRQEVWVNVGHDLIYINSVGQVSVVTHAPAEMATKFVKSTDEFVIVL